MACVSVLDHEGETQRRRGAAVRNLEVKEEGGGKVSSRTLDDETTMNFHPPPQIRI